MKLEEMLQRVAEDDISIEEATEAVARLSDEEVHELIRLWKEGEECEECGKPAAFQLKEVMFGKYQKGENKHYFCVQHLIEWVTAIDALGEASAWKAHQLRKALEALR